MKNFRILLLLFSLYETALPCPSGFHRMPVTSCPQTRCYQFQEQPDLFQQNRQEKQAFCSGQAINTYDGTGGLLEFRTLNEFNRVKEILQATRPSAPYLTSLMYSSAGTLQYVNGANVRQAADTVNTSLPVSSANATLQNKCVGIGVVGDSIDLIVVECDAPQPYICDLQLIAVPAPVLIGDNIRYVGPDRRITLRCTFGASNAIRSVVWLRNGVDITTVSSSGYTVTASPTTFSELVFTAFNRTNHVGSYQCMVTGQLGNLLSRRVSVLKAVAPQIQKAPVNGSFPRGSIGFFSCFPDPSSVPHPTVTWYKDNAELVVPSDSTKYFVNLRSGRLFISDVTDSDNGDYHCRLQNIESSVESVSQRLMVNDNKDEGPGYLLLPDFDISTVRVLEGETLVVDCVADTSFGNVDYVWTYPTGVSNTQATTVLNYLNRSMNPSYFGSLVLDNIQLKVSGEFNVQVRLIGVDPSAPNGETNAPTNGEVMVLVQSVPVITALTTTRIVELGKPFTITCSNTGSPDPNVVWFRNGVLLQNSADYVMNGDDLMISNVQPRDLTSFQCLVNNEVGSSVDELFICGRNGVPGVVVPEVEPFTTTSVRIRWDPPSQPNDDIELLEYDVYFDQRAISSPKSLDITGRQPDETRKWNERSVIIDNLDFDDSVVAVVVARSPQGEGAQPQPDQAAVGFTFGAAPTEAPANVAVNRLNSNSVRITWNPLTSSRGVSHDITYYNVEYILCRTDTEPSLRQTISVNTSTNTPTITLDIPQDSATSQVVQARVQGVTQVRRDPDAFIPGPLSSPATEDGKSCTGFIPPPDPLPIVLGVVIPLIIIIFIVFVVVILILAWLDRRKRGQYFPGKEEHLRSDLDKELTDTNGTRGWEPEVDKEPHYTDNDV